MTMLETLIEQGYITSAGLGVVGEPCGEECVDTDGSDSGVFEGKCGDIQGQYGEEGNSIDVLLYCDSANNEINENRGQLSRLWYNSEFCDNEYNDIPEPSFLNIEEVTDEEE